MRGAILEMRGTIEVTGADASRFLDNLLSNDVGGLAPGRAAYAALLTPQGKIAVDLLASAIPGGVRLDAPKFLVPDLVRKLGLYKLRSKVEVRDTSAETRVAVLWGDGLLPAGLPSLVFDPRLAALGARAYLPADGMLPEGVIDVGPEGWRAHRVTLAVPQGGLDFVYGDAFPHEACMEQLNGIDFKKGCYVGQEIVSRMEHRGTARTRVAPVRIDGLPPEIGAAVTAGERVIGRMGSAIEGRGLALLRLDRAEEARAAGVPLMAGAAMLTVEKPAWARFAFPGETAA